MLIVKADRHGKHWELLAFVYEVLFCGGGVDVREETFCRLCTVMQYERTSEYICLRPRTLDGVPLQRI